MPSAAMVSSPNDTWAAKKRSSSHPVDEPARQAGAAQHRQRERGAAGAHAAIGQQRRQVRDRSVLGDRAAEQHDDENPERAAVSPSRTVAPVDHGSRPGRRGRPLAHVRHARPGNPSTRTPVSRARQTPCASQPRRSAPASSAAAPSRRRAPPASISDSATPRRRVEPARHRARVGHLRGAVADDARARRTRRRGARGAVSAATATRTPAPNTMSEGRMIRRAMKRSSSTPSGGEQTATVMAAMPKAAETASRDHENSSASGFRKMPKV